MTNIEYAIYDSYPKDYICDCAICGAKNIDYWAHICEFLRKVKHD